MPPIVTPVTVTDLPVPTFLSPNAPTALPPTVTTSPLIALTPALPLSCAAVVASYTLLVAVRPVAVSEAGVILASAVCPAARE